MEKYKLYMSLRSPFARRVRVMLEECAIPYETEILDVFNPPATYLQVNPLGRVPTLKLLNGEILIDSNQILMYLRSKYSNKEIFLPRGSQEVYLANWSALAVGVMEWTVTWFLESLKPKQNHDIETLKEAESAIMRTFEYFNNIIPKRKDSVLEYADVDLGVAIGYVEFRLKQVELERYPNLVKYYKDLMKRDSFQKTIPVAS